MRQWRPDGTRPNDERRRLADFQPAKIVRDHRRERRRRGGLPGDDPSWPCGGIALPGSDQARRRSQGRLGRHSGRGPRRHDRGDRTRARRLSCERARIQFPSGRTQLDDSRRRRSDRARRRDAKMRIRPRPLSQSGAVAHPLPSLRDPRLLPPLRSRARALHPAQPQRLFSLRRRVRRQAAAHPRDQGRLRRRRRRASRQGCEKRRARRCGVEGGSGNPARIAARARRARSRFPLPGGRGFGEASGAMRNFREAASARRQFPASRSGSTTF